MFHQCLTSVSRVFIWHFTNVSSELQKSITSFFYKMFHNLQKTLTTSRPLAPVVRLVIFIFQTKLYTPTLPPFLPPTKGNHIVLYPMFGNTIHIPPFIPKTFGQFMSYLVGHRYILILILKVLLRLIRPISGINLSK